LFDCSTNHFYTGKRSRANTVLIERCSTYKLRVHDTHAGESVLRPVKHQRRSSAPDLRDSAAAVTGQHDLLSWSAGRVAAAAASVSG
jgi:hypothetical protein